MPYFPVLIVGSGVTHLVDTSDLTYIEQNPADPFTCFVGVLGAAEFSRLHQDASYVDTITAAHLASGIVVGGFPFAPLVELTRAAGGLIAFQGATVSNVAEVFGDPTLAAINTNGAESPWQVVGDLNVIAADLATASGSTGAPARNRIQLLGTFDNLGAPFFPAVSDFGTTIALTNPHVPDSGLYEYTLSGSVPSLYEIVIGQFSSISALPIARQIAIGSPSFVIDFRRPSRSIAAARIDALGNTINNFNLLCTRTGPGVYDCSMPTTPAGGAFSVTCSLEALLPATNAWSIEITGANTFTIRITDMSTVTPTDAAFHVHAITGESGTGNDGYQSVDSFFSVTIINADP